jgi:TPR repeat protein
MEATAHPNLNALAETYQGGEADSFSLVLGGPLFQLLRKVHLKGDALELLHRRIIASVLLTWFPLLVLSVVGRGAGGVGRISFLHDIEVHARFLVAVPILIAAFRWLRASADSGIPEAQNGLADFYFVQRDYTEAARLVRLAVQQGLPSAETSLGFLYEQGKGVPLDYVSAYTWYSLAMAAGNQAAADGRKRLAQLMTRKQLDEANARTGAIASQSKEQSLIRSTAALVDQ